jgi:hypothetical protein
VTTNKTAGERRSSVPRQWGSMVSTSPDTSGRDDYDLSRCLSDQPGSLVRNHMIGRAALRGQHDHSGHEFTAQ